jgi:hypothetical protein
VLNVGDPWRGWFAALELATAQIARRWRRWDASELGSARLTLQPTSVHQPVDRAVTHCKPMAGFSSVAFFVPASSPYTTLAEDN